VKFANGMLEGVRVVPSPNKGGLIQPRLLIVHDTAGALNDAGSISWLCNPAAKASAHFVVGRDGRITQLVSCNVKAWHAGASSYRGVRNVNDFSVGIEFVNPGLLSPSGASGAKADFGAVFDRKEYRIEEHPALNDPEGAIYPKGLWMPYTEAQLAAGLEIALALKDAYGITEVARHADIAPRRKVDVGPQFPLRWFRGRLLGRADSPEVPEPLEGPQEPTSPEPSPMAMGEEAKPLPGKLYVRPTKLGKFHEWPSFYADNVVATTGGYEVVDQDWFYVAGTDLINELANEKLLWFKVRIPEGTPEHDKTSSGFAFILASNAERYREPE
jgi:N-acetylmuramoyl-L-alanine amidase